MQPAQGHTQALPLGQDEYFPKTIDASHLSFLIVPGHCQWHTVRRSNSSFAQILAVGEIAIGGKDEHRSYSPAFACVCIDGAADKPSSLAFMSDDPLLHFIAKRDEHIARHEQLGAEEPYASQLMRLQRLTEGLTFGLGSIWLMSTRCRSIVDESLTFRFFDDTLQSAVAVWSLAKEGLLASAKREMRYMLESCAKHVYVDLKQVGKPLSDKLAFLKNEVPTSSVTFVNNFQLYEFSDDENKKFMGSILSTYSSLCKYVHRSPEQVDETLRSLQRGISPGFETAKELESFCRQLAKLYDLILVMHFNALGTSLAGDVFTHVLDSSEKWPYHKTKFVKVLSSYFDYKHERQAL